MSERFHNAVRDYDLRAIETQSRVDEMFAEAVAGEENKRIKQQINHEHNSKKVGLGPNTKR